MLRKCFDLKILMKNNETFGILKNRETLRMIAQLTFVQSISERIFSM